MAHTAISSDMRQCIKECSTCHEVCVETLQHCLHMGGKHADAGHIRLLLDCAQICDTSKDFMLRMSDLRSRTCGVCAEVCQKCAEDCDRIGGSDAQMKTCAETCRRCADSCRRMSQSKP